MTVEATPDAAELATLIDLQELSPRQRRAIVGEPEGTPFLPTDRLFSDWQSGEVFDYGEPNAEGIRAMLDVDGTARQLEQVLTLPLRSAPHALVGGSEKGRRLVAEQVPDEMLTHLLAQMSSATAYRKSFHELTWRLDGQGVALNGAGFRPATSCEAAYDRKGRPIGYRQRVANLGQLTAAEWARVYNGEHPGYVRIPKQRALIYTHGTHREPLKGISDLSVAWWAFETRKKLMFLWLQYIELQSQPKVLVYGKDMAQATRNMKSIAQLVAGGYAPAERPADPQAKAVEILETAGKGAALFEPAVRYLESHMTDSVLAGFTKLATGAATTGSGSRALSEDATSLFMDSRQAVADEQGVQTATGLFAPICLYNGLSKSDVPSLRIGPLSKGNVERALSLAEKLLTAPTVNAPTEFLDGLLTVVAPVLGLDPDKLREAIARRATELAEQGAADAIAAAAEEDPAALPGQRAGAPDAKAAELANQVDTAAALAVMDDEHRQRTLAEMLGERGPLARRHIDLATPAKGTKKSRVQHTGGMVALYPTPETARKMAVRGEKAEPVADLHVTLGYLGDDVTGWSAAKRADALEAVHRAVAGAPRSVINARAFAHTTFNADGGPDGDRDPCAVYGIGDTPIIAPLQQDVLDELADVEGLGLPKQHSPFVAHMTAGYGMTAADLTYLGPAVFDRVVVTFGDDAHEIPLDAPALDEEP